MVKTKIALFEGRKIRRHWDKKKEVWYFSVVDIIGTLTDSVNPRDYWFKMKIRVRSDEGSELSTICRQLKMEAPDGKMRSTDCADVESILRIVQSVPSPKAEPLKRWLAMVGYERVQDIADPEKSLNRARNYWGRMGRSKKWVQQRMMGQEIRNKLTDYWKEHEVTKQDEYAILTNIIHEEWSDLSVKEHKSLKGLRTENLRDHMSDAELVFSALAELSSRQIAESIQSRGLKENKIPAKKGGRIAKNARRELEQKTGRSVISKENYLHQPRRRNLPRWQ